jgi:hypothetical protein
VISQLIEPIFSGSDPRALEYLVHTATIRNQLVAYQSGAPRRCWITGAKRKSDNGWLIANAIIVVKRGATRYLG